MKPLQWRALALGLGIAAAPAVGQQPHSDAARLLRSYVRLTIVNENGDSAKPASRVIRPVDVNGVVRVTFDPAALTAYRPVTASTAGDTVGRRLILQLLDDLAEYGRIASALAQSVGQAPAAFDSARARATRWYGSYRRHVVAFFEHQVRLQEPAAQGDLTVRAAQAAEPYMGREQMGDFVRYLQAELVRLLREAERTEGEPLGTLSLLAWRITPKGDSIRVGLRGYDSAAIQNATFVSKISTVMTPEEKASVEFHQELASKVRNVGDLLKTAFKDYVDLATDARASAANLISAIEVAAEALRAAATRPNALVDAVPDSAKAAARRVSADLREISDLVSGIVTPVRGLREDLQSIGTSERNPLAILSTLTEALDTARALGARVRRLEPLYRTLASHVRELGLMVTVDNLTLPDTVRQALSAATAAYGRLEEIVRHARELLPHGDNVARVATAFGDDWIERLDLTPRPLASAPETEILITKAGGDRTDGDLLVFRADLLNSDRTAAGTYEWTFRLEKLGISSRFAAGVGFEGRVFGQRNPNEALRPVPVLGWMLRHRTRGESGRARLWNFIDLSPGMHVVTLTGNTQAVQFGVGLSLNLFQDFVQLGLGRKLQPENADDRWYWYFGLGLFKLARMGQ